MCCALCECCLSLWGKLISCVGKLVANIIVGLISLLILGGFVVLILYLTGHIACGPDGTGCQTSSNSNRSGRSIYDMDDSLILYNLGQIHPKFAIFN